MKKYIIICLSVICLCIGGLCYLYNLFVKKSNISIQDKEYLYIYPNYTFEDVVDILRMDFSLDNEYALRTVSDVKKYTNSIKPGRYHLSSGMNNNQLINLLRSGKQEPVQFTFNNIRKIEDLASVVSKQLFIDSLTFVQTVNSPSIQNRYGFSSHTILAMFIPNTYEIYWNTSIDNFLKRMYVEYQAFWNKSRMDKACKLGLKPLEIITLASIIEEETNSVKEYSKIAGVYINRLKKGWKLEACPTLKFALNDFSIKRILDKHLDTDSPYNTYKNLGLPPGPIRMPSPITIDAVLNCEQHSYMFFCAKSDFSGTHHFSRTLSEHNRYAKEYHRELNKRRIYK